MKKLVVLAAVAVGSSIITSAKADTYVGNVKLDWGAPYYSSGYGGEFKATLTITSGPYVIAKQSAVTELPGDSSLTNPSIFQTFCIQEGLNDVNVTPGQLYAAVIGDNAQTHHSPPPETLSPITQVLFAEFWNGSLPNYDFTNAGGLRSASAGELQDAIWYAQGDITAFINGASDAGISNTVLAQAWYNAAANYVLHNVTDPYLGDPTGAKQVKVLGLYDTKADALAGGTKGIAQAQLVEVVPVPNAFWSGLVLLGGVGVFGVVRRRHRRFNV